MKINKLLVMSLAASFVLASCSKDNEPSKKKLVNEGDTYSSLTLRVPSTPGTRAVNQSNKTGEGKESKVVNIALNSSVDPQKNWDSAITKPADYGTATAGQFWEVSNAADGVVYSVGAFKTKTGDKDLGLILNKTADAKMSEIPSKTIIYGGDGTTVNEQFLKDVIQDTGFTMTSEVVPFNAVGGVTKPQADDQATPKNLCKFESVERLVSKVQVGSPAAGLAQLGDYADQTNVGVITTDLTYAVQGSQTQIYLYNDNAGSRTIGADNQYKDLTPAPIKKLVYTGDAAIKANTLVGGSSLYAARAIDKVDDMESWKNCEYFFPTATAKKAFAIWGEVAYVTVYAKFEPAKFTVLLKKFEEKQTTDPDPDKKFYWYAVDAQGKVNEAAIVYKNTTGQSPKEINGTDPKYDANWNGTDATSLTGFTWKFGQYTNGTRTVAAADLNKGDYVGIEKPADGTFYVAKGKIKGTDKMFFVSKEQAMAITGFAKDKIYTYKEGKMGYRVLINRVLGADNETIENCDTRRNNWYRLKLTGVTGLGFNYDDLNPEDPNLPKSEDDPKTPIDDVTPETPVNNVDTYMRFEATVLPWNVVSRDVVLDL